MYTAFLFSPCISLSLIHSIRCCTMLEGSTGGSSGGAPPRPPTKTNGGSTSGSGFARMSSTSNDQQRDSSASVGMTSGGYFSDYSSYQHPHSSASITAGDMSPWNLPSSPYASSPWCLSPAAHPFAGAGNSGADLFPPGTGLIGSLVREEGHIYSLAAAGGLLYTGSDSKNIRVWKDLHEYSGFKSASGLVKAIIVSSNDRRIFSGHQDGKIRVWTACPKDPKIYKRAGTLPRLKDLLRCSLNPSNYMNPRRKGRAGGRRGGFWIRHSDAISCLTLDADHGLLYSGSWDRTLKVWRIADCKCIESIAAHDDAINAVITAANGYVFTGSADGTVKVWKREATGGPRSGFRHDASQTLLRQECAVTTLAVTPSNSTVTAGGVLVYCGSSDGVVNYWEQERNMAHGGTLRGHKIAVLCLAAAGALLFSGSADKTICVWRRDGAEHICMSVLTGHSGPVKCLAVEADSSGGSSSQGTATPPMWMVYSGSLDKSVKVWKVAEMPLMHSHESSSASSSYYAGRRQFDSY